MRWDTGGRDHDWYDGLQVCENGHVITNYATSQPTSTQNHCHECGAKTITACPTCNTPMRGYRHISGVFHVSDSPAPDYCMECGSPMPWQAAKLENLAEVLSMSGISESDLAIVRSAIPDIAKETPKSESATMKVKVILKKLGSDAYGVALKVVTDVASEYSKKMLNSQH